MLIRSINLKLWRVIMSYRLLMSVLMRRLKTIRLNTILLERRSTFSNTIPSFSNYLKITLSILFNRRMMLHMMYLSSQLPQQISPYKTLSTIQKWKFKKHHMKWSLTMWDFRISFTNLNRRRKEVMRVDLLLIVLQNWQRSDWHSNFSYDLESKNVGILYRLSLN